MRNFAAQTEIKELKIYLVFFFASSFFFIWLYRDGSNADYVQ